MRGLLVGLSLVLVAASAAGCTTRSGGEPAFPPYGVDDAHMPAACHHDAQEPPAPLGQPYDAAQLRAITRTPNASSLTEAEVQAILDVLAPRIWSFTGEPYHRVGANLSDYSGYAGIVEYSFHGNRGGDAWDLHRFFVRTSDLTVRTAAHGGRIVPDNVTASAVSGVENHTAWPDIEDVAPYHHWTSWSPASTCLELRFLPWPTNESGLIPVEYVVAFVHFDGTVAEDGIRFHPVTGDPYVWTP